MLWRELAARPGPVGASKGLVGTITILLANKVTQIDKMNVSEDKNARLLAREYAYRM